MQRYAVQSSSVKTLGYDRVRSLLEVEYHNGAVYRYFDVPELHFERLTDGRSIGRYINACIKVHYRFEKMRDAD